MKQKYSPLSVVLTFLAFAPLSGQEPAGDARLINPKSANPAELLPLPEPMDDIKGNLHVFEKDGLLEVVKTEWRYVPIVKKYGVVWRLRVAHPMTYARLLIYLREFREVRFYRKIKDHTTEIDATLVNYPAVFDSFATDRFRLYKGDEFDVFLYMTELEKLKLSLAANRFEIKSRLQD